MKLLALALAVGPIATGPGTPFFAGMPPERFQTLATVKLVVTAPERIKAVCDSDIPDGKTLYGCARSDLFGRYIVILDPCPLGEREETARILCHEIAHSAGRWPANHPL